MNELTQKTSNMPQDSVRSPDSIKSHWYAFASSLRYIVCRILEKDLMKVASSLTYTTILALVPMLTVVLALFTAFPLFNEFQGSLEEFLTRNLMPEAVSETIMQYLNQFAAQASGLTAIGSLFLIVTSIMLIMTIDQTFNDIWQVRQRRPLAQRLLVYWAIISLGPILTGASLWASSVLARSSLGYIGALSGPVDFALSYTPFLFTALGFTALFLYVPNRRVWWRDALTGGVLTAAALELMKAGFAFYLTRFPTYTLIYGAFATLPIFLLWVYISWMIVLLGAAATATLPDLRHRHWVKRSVPGTAFCDAINLLHLLWLQQQQNAAGLSLRDMSHALQRDGDELLLVLDTLKLNTLVANTEEHGDEHWVLCADLRQLAVSSLMDTFLLDRSHASAGPVKYVIDYLFASLEHGVSHLEELFAQPDKLQQSGASLAQGDTPVEPTPGHPPFQQPGG